jgi:hypothetical protein
MKAWQYFLIDRLSETGSAKTALHDLRSRYSVSSAEIRLFIAILNKNRENEIAAKKP